MKKYKIGYITVFFDLFHIGHLNILKKAKENCKYLIVGVATDAIAQIANKEIFVPYKERIEIVKSIKYVDKAVPQDSIDKLEEWEKYKFDVVFVGSDWQGTQKWNVFEKKFAAMDVSVIYFPYTLGTCSTKLRDALFKISDEKHKII